MSIDLDEHLDAIRLRDAAAFGRWLAGAELPVRASLRTFAARVDTEAVLQEALLRVWQVAPRVERDGRPNALLRFAVRVARNTAIDELRRRAMEVPQIEEEVPVHVPLPDPLLRRAIADCRDALPKQPARALAARLDTAGDAADEELARALGMTKNTFLQNFTRARKLLRACLESKGVAA